MNGSLTQLRQPDVELWHFNPLIATLKPHSNGPSYSNTVQWLGCYIWYSKERTGRGRSPPRPLLAVPNATAYPSTASHVSVPTLYYSTWHYNCLWRQSFKRLFKTCLLRGYGALWLLFLAPRVNYLTSSFLTYLLTYLLSYFTFTAHTFVFKILQNRSWRCPRLTSGPSERKDEVCSIRRDGRGSRSWGRLASLALAGMDAMH